MNDETILAAVNQIYSVTTDKHGLSQAISAITTLFRANIGGIYFADGKARVQNEHVMVGIDQAAFDDYQRVWVAHDVRNDDCYRLPVCEPYRDGQFRLHRDFRLTPIYNDFYRRIDSEHATGGHLFRQSDRVCNITLHRRARAGAYDDHDFSVYRIVMSHLTRALQVRRHLLTHEAERHGLAAAIDKLSVGVILVDGDGRVRTMNDAARDLVAANDGLRIDHQRLAAAEMGDTQRLRQLIAAAAMTNTDFFAAPGGIMPIRRPSNRRSFSVMVAPLRRQDIVATSTPEPVAVVIRDPERQSEPTSAALAKIYGLTPAEARLAAALAVGGRMEDLADAWSISRNTLRTQIRQVFAKTGTKNQSDLVRRLAAQFTIL